MSKAGITICTHVESGKHPDVLWVHERQLVYAVCDDCAMRIEVDEDLETVQKNLFPYPGDRAKKLGITANVIGDGFWKRHPSTGEWIQGFRALALGKTAGLE